MPDAGRIVGEFEELRVIGAGATARVISARAADGSLVLLKLGAPAYARTLRDEARVLFRARGPATQTLLAVIEVEPRSDGRLVQQEGGAPALVLEHRVGQTLDNVWAHGASIDPERTAVQIANSLAALHHAGFAHGDVKPANIVLDERGAFLIDFGLSVPRETHLPLGATPRYLPRQAASLGTAQTRDLHALGLVIAELVAPELRLLDDPASALATLKLPGRMGDVVRALVLDDARSKPRASWVAHFLDGAQTNETALASQREAHARTAYLAMYPEALAGPHRAHAEAHPWLLEACEFSGQLGSQPPQPLEPLRPHQRREFLVRLFGERATRLEPSLLETISEAQLCEVVRRLGQAAAFELVSLRQLRLALLQPLADLSHTPQVRTHHATASALALALSATPPEDWALEQVEVTDAHDPALVLAGARALRLMGQVGRAFVLIERGLERSPRDSALLAGAAELARRVGNVTLCEQLLQRLAEVAPDAEIRSRGAATRARLAFDNGDPEAAIRLLNAPETAPEFEVLALARAVRGELEQARAVLREGATVPADSEQRARLWGALGYVVAASDPQEAMEAFTRAAEHATNAGALVEEATYLTGLGAAAASLGHLQAAATAAERAWLLWESLGAADRATRALLNLGAIHRMAGDQAIARFFATKAAEFAIRAGDATAQLYANLVLADAADEGARTWLASLDRVPLPLPDQLLVAARLLRYGALELEGERDRLDEFARRPNTPSGPRAEWLTARLELARKRGEATRARQFAVELVESSRNCPVAALAPALFGAAQVADEAGLVDTARQAQRRLTELATLLLQHAGDLRSTVEKLDWVVAALAAPSAVSASTPDQNFRLEQLVRSLSNEASLRDLLRGVLDALVAWTRAERGVLLLRGPDDRLIPRAARNLHASDLSEEQLQLSMTLAKRALDQRKPVLAMDAIAELPDLHASVHALHLRSVLVVPLIARGEAIGVAYLDDRLRQGTFGPHELEWAATVATLAAAMVSRAMSEARLRRLMRKEAYLRKTLEEQLSQSLTQLSTIERSLADQRSELADHPFKAIIGRSQALRSTLSIAERAARAEVHVLVLGESGTGKELLAAAIHKASPRRDKVFISENVAAIPDSLLESALFGHVKGAFTGADRSRMGLFEAADGGTLFLDEVGEMSLPMQTKLLRVLEDGIVRPVGSERTRKVSVRVIAATHRNLEELVEKRTFREDLFYRLSVLPIRLPPLRERRSDIPELVRAFVDRYATNKGVSITQEALAYMEAHPFPGNVRQLENIVRRALILSPDCVDLAHVTAQPSGSLSPSHPLVDPASIRLVAGKTLRDQLDDVERTLVHAALEATKGNQTQAAKTLGISRFGLAKMMKRLGILDDHSASS